MNNTSERKLSASDKKGIRMEICARLDILDELRNHSFTLPENCTDSEREGAMLMIKQFHQHIEDKKMELQTILTTLD